ncbi:diguanylate cyclase [Bosea sp. OK403]|uniref:sensor domain-containing diguanylate cyclase n=1 Tax=Bosea sp. OK403 TaxID=1855286 RepID=UPI001FCD5C5B|nr:diguanylate cyclase [Bosea sp. OK403]
MLTMHANRVRLFFLSSLKGRVLVLTLVALLAVAVPSAIALSWIVNLTVVKLGTLFAEKQILFDRYRGLESLMREVSLAETVARSPAILEWAQDEDDPAKAQRGLAELEHYRLSFKDKSYFMVIGRSGNYYFNDKDNAYQNDRKRYTLSRENPRDGWYYKTAALGSGCHLNVDHDDNLQVTKVWINCVIRQGEHVLGIIGTGVDLSQFIREVVDIPQTGVQSMFVDRNGAVQAHRDPRLVDFHSLTKDLKAKKTVFLLLDDEEDRAALSLMMAQVSHGDALVQSRFMRVGGHKTLVGVGYLDRLGWFNITLMDVDAIIDRRLFAPIAVLLAVILLAAAALMTYLFKRSVLDRLARVETSVNNVRGGAFKALAADTAQDEIGRLSRALDEMARAVADNTDRLEATVRERTETLERLAHADPLTGVLNRRGFEDAFAREQNRAGRAGRQSGLALVDLDLFKSINDEHGHQAGDKAILEIVGRLSAVLRSYDICARWGGDEFFLLIAECDLGSLSSVASKLVSVVAREPVRLADGTEIAMTVSVGACLVPSGQSFQAAAAQADAALYAAKHNGRGTFAIYDATRHGWPGKPTLRLG